ncbi:MAG: ABC transporter permease subunit [Magnetospirillum sp.]|nr:ABC transporter permease subunit [Magnetospirillum sp.]
MTLVTEPEAVKAAIAAAPAALSRPRPATRPLAKAVSEAAGRILPPLIGLAVLLGLWELACSRPGAMLPGPFKVVTDTWELIVNPFFDHGGTDKGLFWHLAASLKRVAMGFALSASVGILLGVLIGQSRMAFRALDPIFQVLRTVPPLAWLPISLAAFKAADPSAIFVIFITSVWPIILNTAVGVANIPQDYRNVAAEMLIGGVGIGFFIWDAWNSSLMSEIILALVYVGLVGFMLDRLITALGKKISG